MKASICIATYNSEKTIRRTLDSVLYQTFQDFEVVIVDDHSTDNTINIINNEYCAKDNRFKLFVNTTDKKLPYIDSFNKSYEYASGELLCRLDHDDVLLPDYLEYMVSYMDSHKDVDACCSRLTFYDGIKNIDIDNIDISRREENYIQNYTKWIPYFNTCPPAIYHLSGYCDGVYLFHNPGSCMRKEFYDRAHPKCIIYYAGDVIFWLQVMANGGKLAVIDDYKILYTGRHASATWSQSNENYETNDHIQYYYVSYFTHKALSHYDDDYVIKDSITIKDLKGVMMNTVLFFKDLLEKENLYENILQEFKI